jgi:hypothetical protein
MISSIFFVLRIGLAWAAAFVLSLLIWLTANGGHNGPSMPFVVAALFTIGWKMTTAISHVHRVRLIAGRVDAGLLSSRQRRQIEVPFEAGEAFDIVDATIRELPRSEEIESARDSLQVRAKVKHFDPYRKNNSNAKPPSPWLGAWRNQILATVTPRDGTGSVTLICEPEGSASRDWFKVDDGTNLENAEAITRAIIRRVSERRRSEQNATTQTITEKELAVAKLSLLHAQVEPHFLYNTLASAQVLTRSDPARADEMLGNLITYLRHSLPRTEDAPSTLGEELKRTRAYLDILKIRMGARLNLQVDMAQPLLALAFPPMMLQTLVENAIKHGLEPKPGGGTVWILARNTDHGVAVTVPDDGRGFSAEGAGTGIGLRNVRERLRLAYGGAASFAIGANFPSGVAATITVPATMLTGDHHA